MSLVTQPGDEPQPIYTNDFVAVRVGSAVKFVEHAKEVMLQWNSANRDAKGETRLVFDVEETKLGEHAATQYSLDVGGLDGGAVVPGVREAMEKLFGPGGKLRCWIVTVDDTNVLLAAGTAEQVTAELKVLDRNQPIDWSRGELAECNALLPAEADWRLFIDAHRYVEWLRRQAAAMVGVPVIGGPLVKDFPAAPPVGLAGGFREGEFWLDAAAPIATIKSADIYLARSRRERHSG